MAAEWPVALEGLAFARALRDSVWMYPLVNAGHILGVALLVGAIVPLDLRLMGFVRGMPLAPALRTLGGVAAMGLALAAIFGLLLFTTRASEYIRSPFFLAKVGLIGVGVANAVLLRITLPWQLVTDASPTATIPVRVRVAATLSLTAWVATLVLGRLVGYF